VLAARSQPVATIGPTTDRVSARFAPPRAGGLGQWPECRAPLTSRGDLGAEPRRAAPGGCPEAGCRADLAALSGGLLGRRPRTSRPARARAGQPAHEPASPRTRPRNPGIRTPVVLRGIREIRGRSDGRRGIATDRIHARPAAPDRLRTGPERARRPGSSLVRTPRVSRNDENRRDGSPCRRDDPRLHRHVRRLRRLPRPTAAGPAGRRRESPATDRWWPRAASTRPAWSTLCGSSGSRLSAGACSIGGESWTSRPGLTRRPNRSSIRVT